MSINFSRHSSIQQQQQQQQRCYAEIRCLKWLTNGILSIIQLWRFKYFVVFSIRFYGFYTRKLTQYKSIMNDKSTMKWILSHSFFFRSLVFARCFFCMGRTVAFHTIQFIKWWYVNVAWVTQNISRVLRLTNDSILFRSFRYIKVSARLILLFITVSKLRHTKNNQIPQHRNTQHNCHFICANKTKEISTKSELFDKFSSLIKLNPAKIANILRRMSVAPNTKLMLTGAAILIAVVSCSVAITR